MTDFIVPILPDRGPRESVIEDKLVEMIEEDFHGLCEKILPAGRRGRPDRLCTVPGIPLFQVETKRPKGGKVRDEQERDHARRAKLGHHVWIVWNETDLMYLKQWIRNQLSAKNV